MPGEDFVDIAGSDEDFGGMVAAIIANGEGKGHNHFVAAVDGAVVEDSDEGVVGDVREDGKGAWTEVGEIARQFSVVDVLLFAVDAELGGDVGVGFEITLDAEPALFLVGVPVGLGAVEDVVLPCLASSVGLAVLGDAEVAGGAGESGGGDVEDASTLDVTADGESVGVDVGARRVGSREGRVDGPVAGNGVDVSEGLVSLLTPERVLVAVALVLVREGGVEEAATAVEDGGHWGSDGTRVFRLAGTVGVVVRVQNSARALILIARLGPGAGGEITGVCFSEKSSRVAREGNSGSGKTADLTARFSCEGVSPGGLGGSFGGFGRSGYSSWKSWRALVALSRKLKGSQVAWDRGSPAQCTRYWYPRPDFRQSRICSTSHSCCPSITSGGGGEGSFWLSKAGGVYGERRDAWKTGVLILQDAGILSLYDTAPTFLRTSKGPNRRSPIFLVGRSTRRFVPSR